MIGSFRHKNNKDENIEKQAIIR